MQKVDPTATLESCRDHSIGEIRELTQEHADSHHSGGGNAGVADKKSGDFSNSEHHGNNSRNRHD
ncbi:MAG: hypothetical protein LBR98_03750 [Syntrophomonadaceae bacterium]|nr:hypothetical protein [Syntrophomonadaceae bacterium]